MAEPLPWPTDFAAAVVHPREPTVWLPDDAGPILRLDLGGPFWFPDVEPVLQPLIGSAGTSRPSCSLFS